MHVCYIEMLIIYNPLGPGQDQTQARHAGSGFYYIKQKPKTTWAWFFGKACSPDPEPVNQARPATAGASVLQARSRPKIPSVFLPLL
jgi:hypothetical protein